MKQTNSRTNFSRNIRRIPINSTTTTTTSTPVTFSLFGGSKPVTPATTTTNYSSQPKTPLPVTNVNFVSKSVDQLDLGQITGWTRVYPPDYDPDDTDPISFESLGNGKSSEVVELRCSTPKVRCLLFKNSIKQCIMNGMTKCPVCKTRFKIPGPQPSGTMRLSLNPRQHCDGYPGQGSIYIVIIFRVVRGVRMRSGVRARSAKISIDSLFISEIRHSNCYKNTSCIAQARKSLENQVDKLDCDVNSNTKTQVRRESSTIIRDNATQEQAVMRIFRTR